MTIATLVGFLWSRCFSARCAFRPALARSKCQGLTEYGNLAATYSEGFDNKWVRGGAGRGPLARPTSSHWPTWQQLWVVREMRVVPFQSRT